MATKQRTRFAGRAMKADMLVGKKQTITDKELKSKSKYPDTPNYYDVQALVEGIGLVRYGTSAKYLVRELEKEELPMRDKVILKDWRGLYFEDTVFTLEEEEEFIRREYGINY